MTRRFWFGLIASPLAAKVLPESTRVHVLTRGARWESFIDLQLENSTPVRIDVQVDGKSAPWTIPVGPKRWVRVPTAQPLQSIRIVPSSPQPFKLWDYSQVSVYSMRDKTD
jgi:hypothetical protein